MAFDVTSPRAPLLVAVVVSALAWAGCAGTLTDPGAFMSTGSGDDAATIGADAAAEGGAPGSACPDVVGLFASTCTTSGCHDTTTKAQGLDLASPGVATRLVGVAASEGVGLLIDPSTPSKSVVYTKLLPTPPFGAQMPTGHPLTSATIQCVLAWVTSEASAGTGPSDAGSLVGLDSSGPPDAGHEAGTTGPFTTLRVAAGQTSAVMDGQGQTWAADVGFTGGTPAVSTTAVAIANTDSSVLYNGQRYGNPSFSYAFTVPNGTYTVTLRFAELYVTADGQRLFSIAINGKTVEPSFDIYALAGAMNTAVDRSYPVTVTGGSLHLAFDQGSVQFPKVDAIEIAQGAGDGGP